MLLKFLAQQDTGPWQQVWDTTTIQINKKCLRMLPFQGKLKGSKLTLFLKFYTYIFSKFIFLVLWLLAVFSVLKSVWATELLFVSSVQRDMSRVAKPTNATEEKNTLPCWLHINKLKNLLLPHCDTYWVLQSRFWIVVVTPIAFIKSVLHLFPFAPCHYQ